MSKRLRAIAELVPSAGSIVDVGTDHGYIPVWLASEGAHESITATDIRSGPLRNAIASAEAAGVKDKIRFVLCDGLDACEPSDTVIIAGMGGETIAEILRRAPWTKEDNRLLILQPMTKDVALRRFLFDSGYRIEREVLVKDTNIIYLIMLAVGGDSEPPELFEYYAGVNVVRDELFRERLENLTAKTKRAIAGLEQSNKPQDMERLRELRSVLERLSLL